MQRSKLIFSKGSPFFNNSQCMHKFLTKLDRPVYIKMTTLLFVEKHWRNAENTKTFSTFFYGFVLRTKKKPSIFIQQAWICP